MNGLVYPSFILSLASGLDFASESVRCCLLSEAHIPSRAHTGLVDASPEVVGEGYVAGGLMVSGLSVSRTGDTISLHASNITFSGVTLSARYAVLYLDKLANSPLICMLDFGRVVDVDDGILCLNFDPSKGIVSFVMG